jgi:glutamate synthase domain-containing protein 2
MACATGKCAYGITAQDPELRARLDPEEAGDRLANFIKATAEEVKILTMLSGHDDIKDLSEEDLRAMEPNVAAITGLKLIGYEKRLPLWENGRGS